MASSVVGASAAPEIAPVRPNAAPARVVRVGLLGLGQVGQAVARLAAASGRPSGLRFKVESALVRDVGAPRRCPRPPRVTSNPAAFLRGQYHVVVEALGTLEPARAIVARLLGRGVAVVTANKALVAAHGDELQALADRRATSFRYEACALAGVPFLGTLAARPYAAAADHVAAVLNGTSNFVLTVMERDGLSLEDALKRAWQLGLAEPDPSRDLDGEDAADKLTLLARLFGWGRLARPGLPVEGVRTVTPRDLQAARALGGTLKPIAWTRRDEHGVQAYIGPAFVDLRHPLAALDGSLNGIALGGRYVPSLYFSGPGAGPDVTAATLLDDAVEAYATVRRPADRPRSSAPVRVSAPATGWFLRLTFPGFVPDAGAVRALVAESGLVVESVHGDGDTRWLLVAQATPEHAGRAVAELERRHRIKCKRWRRL